MPVHTHPVATLAGDLYALARDRLGVIAGSAWFFSGNEALDGHSPLEMLKAGHIDRVKRLILALPPRGRQ